MSGKKIEHLNWAIECVNIGHLNVRISARSHVENGNRINSPRQKSPRKKFPRKNAVEREPVETRVLNPNASEASYKAKQRSYRKTKLRIFFFFFGKILVGAILSGGFYPGTKNFLSPERQKN